MAEYRCLFVKYDPYSRSSVGQITPDDILPRLKKLPTAERHHAFAAGRAFFRFGVSQHYIERSPMADMEPPAASRPRERVLSGAELTVVCKAAISGQTTFDRIIALCLLSGRRRGEIARLKRSSFREDRITIVSDITKNGHTRAFPIGPVAKRILDTIPKTSETCFFPAGRGQVKGKPATVFNGGSKAKAAPDKETGVYDWTIHDLRRTVSSGMAALTIPQVVVEKLLNHVSGGSQSQIARFYNVYEYQSEMREAVEKWEAHFTSLLPRACQTQGHLPGC